MFVDKFGVLLYGLGLKFMGFLCESLWWPAFCWTGSVVDVVVNGSFKYCKLLVVNLGLLKGLKVK